MEELTLEKKKYISSKRAAKLSGYAKDYIGQLCRAGALPAKMVGRSWYIEEDALKEHRKTYKGEPIIDSSVWDVGHIEEDSRPLNEIAAEYTSKQDEDKKKHLLSQLFDLKYEKDVSPLLPTMARKEPQAVYTPTAEDEDVKTEDDSKSLPINIEKIIDDEAFPLVSPEIPQKSSKIVYFDPDDVRVPSTRSKRRVRVHRKQLSSSPPKEAKKLVYVAVAVLALFLLSSLFIDQKKTYERRGTDYVISSENIMLRGFGGLAQSARDLLAAVVTNLE